MKVKNLKITSAFLTLVVASNMAFAPINECFAETNYKQGTFISENTEQNEVSYNQYVVKTGDTLSKISQKICRYFKEEMSTKYWPALAFLNHYPRVVKPGDIICFPETFEQLVELNNNLRKTGWTARYINNNNVYGNDEDSYKSYNIYEFLREIYGPKVKIDDNFVNKYLEAIRYDNNDNTDSLDSIDNSILFILTEWIPTLDDLGMTSKKRK